MRVFTLTVKDLVQRVFPETLFRRLREPREEIIAVDGSDLIPQLDTDTEEGIEAIPSRADTALPEKIQHPSPSASTESDDPAPSIEDIFRHLCESEPLYSVEEKKWLHCPNTSTKNKEHEIAEFLNKILGRVRRLLYSSEESDDDWVFSAHFSEKPLDIDGVKRKLGLILVRRKFSRILLEHDEPHLDFDWRHIRSFGQIKPDACYSRRRAGYESRDNIREVYVYDMSRRFVLMFSLFDAEMALHKFDRSGNLVSPTFNIHKEPEEFLKVILGMALGEDFYLGLDPSFSSDGDKDFITVEDTKYEILKVVCTMLAILGRGTTVLLVRDLNTGQRQVIKDQWVNREENPKEVDILLGLKAKGKERNVVRLEKGGVVAFQIGGSKMLDSTENDRKNLDEKCKSKIEIRDHYRLVLTPYGEAITMFESLREFVSVFKDCAEAIRDLYKDGYYHRDISYRNLIIVSKNDAVRAKAEITSRSESPESQKVPTLPQKNATGPPKDVTEPRAEAIETSEDNSGTRNGFLIDLDCATTIEYLEDTGPEFTGTTPSMPVEMLENYGCKHKYYFDLESLFYVMVYVCLLTDGPRKKGHYPFSGYDFESSSVDIWDIDNTIPDGPEEKRELGILGRRRRATMTDVDLFKSDILDNLPAYFEPIKHLLLELRRVLFQFTPGHPDLAITEDYLPISERTDVDRVFKRYIDALGRALDQLPATDDWPDLPTEVDKVADGQGNTQNTPEKEAEEHSARDAGVKDRESVKETAQDSSKPDDGSDNEDSVDSKKSESGGSPASDSGYYSSKQSKASATLLSKRHRTDEEQVLSPKRACSETTKAEVSRT